MSDVRCLAALAAAVILAAGCARDRKPPLAPPMPPKPSTTATAGAIGAAARDVTAAKQNVLAGRDKAKADDGPGAAPLLEKADGQLTDALGDLSQAKAHTAELEAKIGADRAAHDAREKAIGDQLSAAAQQNEKLAAENKKLRNEVIRKVQLAVGGFGSALLLAAIGCAVAGVWFGFVPGLRIAIIAGSAGGAAVALAALLPKIVLAFEIAIVAAIAAALGWILFEFWRNHRSAAAVVDTLKAEKDSLLAMLAQKTPPKPAAPAPVAPAVK